MPGFQPRIAAAKSASDRMDALCEFIEFWLGGRVGEYGELVNEVNLFSLPMPLRRLYEFAGRWPGFDKRRESKWTVAAFSTQDSLRTLNQLEISDDNRVKFIDENQGCWVCSTLVNEEDPPVWCSGDFSDDDGKPLQGEKKVCDSLSQFLVTFVLQEITLGSRCSLCDDGLSEQFESARADAIRVWDQGPYVYGSDASFYLWNGVLVADLWGSYFFGANHERAIAFLTKNQGPISIIGLMAELPWRLNIAQNGSAKLRYSSWPVEEEAEVQAGTFDFDSLLKQLLEQCSSEEYSESNPIIFLHRRGQSCAEGKQLPNKELVSRIFIKSLENLVQPHAELSRLYKEQWPYW